MWVPYISVVDLEETLAEAATLGGEKLMGPLAVEGVGTIAVLKDPLGAVFGLLQPEELEEIDE
jgi:predicted enzyme related to lactoylglutathione lyase